MGISFSKRHDHVHQNHHHNHHQQIQNQNENNRPQPPPPLPPPSTNPQSTFAFAANAPLPIQQFPTFPQPNNNNNYNYNQSYYSRPPPPPVNYNTHQHPQHQQHQQQQQYANYATPYYNYSSSSGQHPPPQVGGWGQPMMMHQQRQQQVVQVAPYVEHQNAKKVKNDVNVHKDTIAVVLDGEDNTCLVSFTFDAMIDGSITISYFAKEGPLCKFTPVYPEIPLVKVPFKKGLGQKFVQPPGTGVDLGFFAVEDLSKPSPEDDVYPLVISAGASEPSTPIDEHSNEKLVASSSHAQITQAILEQKDGKNFTVKVVKQILWIDGVRYELREIFGISNSNETTVSEVAAGKECVICMTEEKNTAVLPCRHMCMCSECAKQLRLQSDKCPVCRQPIKELIEIKVDDDEES